MGPYKYHESLEKTCAGKEKRAKKKEKLETNGGVMQITDVCK